MQSTMLFGLQKPSRRARIPICRTRSWSLLQNHKPKMNQSNLHSGNHHPSVLTSPTPNLPRILQLSRLRPSLRLAFLPRLISHLRLLAIPQGRFPTFRPIGMYHPSLHHQHRGKGLLTRLVAVTSLEWMCLPSPQNRLPRYQLLL